MPDRPPTTTDVLRRLTEIARADSAATSLFAAAAQDAVEVIHYLLAQNATLREHVDRCLTSHTGGH